MRRQIIQTANRVPNLKSRSGISQQQELLSRDIVLVGRGTEPRVRTGRIGISDPFALAHRIECENQITEPGETLAALLITRVAFPRIRVAHLKENSRIGRLAGGRNIQIGADEQARAALVDELLQPIAGALELPGNAGIQRRPLGLAADQFPECLACPALAVADGCRIGKQS